MENETTESRYAAYEAAEAQSRQDAIAAIKAKCAEWEAAGYVQVKVEYDGSGDDGSIQQVTCEDESGAEFEADDAQASDDLFWPLCFQNVSYDNDGGGGEIIVNVKERTITRQEYYYETVREDATKEPEVL